MTRFPSWLGTAGLAVYAVLAWVYLLEFPHGLPLPTLDLSWSAIVTKAGAEHWAFGRQIMLNYGPWAHFGIGFFYGPLFTADYLFQLGSKAVLVALICRVSLALSPAVRWAFLAASLVTGMLEWEYTMTLTVLYAGWLTSEDRTRAGRLIGGAAVLLAAGGAFDEDFLPSSSARGFCLRARAASPVRARATDLVAGGIVATGAFRDGFLRELAAGRTEPQRSARVFARDARADRRPIARDGLRSVTGRFSSGVGLAGLDGGFGGDVVPARTTREPMGGPGRWPRCSRAVYSWPGNRGSRAGISIIFQVILFRRRPHYDRAALLFPRRTRPRLAPGQHHRSLAAGRGGHDVGSACPSDAACPRTRVPPAHNLRILFAPAAERTRLDALVAEVRVRSAMPQTQAVVGRARIDAFGTMQGLLLLNDLNYAPVPTLQVTWRIRRI